MRYIKTYEGFAANVVNNLKSKIEREGIKLIFLIGNGGLIVNKEGYIKRGIGIMGVDGKEYPAGVSEDGELWYSIVDMHNNILSVADYEDEPTSDLGPGPVDLDIAWNTQTYKENYSYQYTILKNFPQLVGILKSVKIDPRIKKEFGDIFDSEEIGLL